ncbi:MAG: hypothetical protein ABI678_18965 [Kofleriaceae bacterium]
MARVILVERGLLTDEERVQLATCIAIRECALIRIDRGEARELAVYEAPSTERVRESHHSAGVAFERAWPADET